MLGSTDWAECSTVNLPEDAVLLRIFFGEDDRCGGRPLYEAIVNKARELKR